MTVVPTEDASVVERGEVQGQLHKVGLFVVVGCSGGGGGRAYTGRKNGLKESPYRSLLDGDGRMVGGEIITVSKLELSLLMVGESNRNRA